MKGTIKRLDKSGHTAVGYDTDEGVVAAAEQILANASLQGSAVFSTTTRERVPVETGAERRKALETESDLIVVPQMAGG